MLLEEVGRVLSNLAESRTTFQGHVADASADISALLAQFEAAGAAITSGLNQAEVFVSSLDNVLRPSDHRPATGESPQSAAALDQLLSRVTEYTDEITPDHSKELIAALAQDQPDRLRDAMRDAAAQHLQKFDDALEWIDEKLASLVGASEDILEAATTFSETIGEAKEALVEKTGEFTKSVSELVAALDQLTSNGGEALAQQLTAQLAEKISEKVDALTDGALESIEDFSKEATRLTDGIVDQLSDITDTFDTILDVVEPIQPVIELAGSVA